MRCLVSSVYLLYINIYLYTVNRLMKQDNAIKI